MDEYSDALTLTIQICTQLKMFQCRMSQTSQIFTQGTAYSLPGKKRLQRQSVSSPKC